MFSASRSFICINFTSRYRITWQDRLKSSPPNDAFHGKLTATAESCEGNGSYARRSEAALASLMEKVSARAMELEASAAARLNQFRVFLQTAVCRASMMDRSHNLKKCGSTENCRRCRAGGRGRFAYRKRRGSQTAVL